MIEITNRDINLSTVESNNGDSAMASTRRLSKKVVPNKTTAIKRQKENAFLSHQRLHNIESAIKKSNQNNGLNNEKW